MKTFIVHLYKCEKNDPHYVVGIAEEVGNDGKKAFTNAEDLFKIVSCEDLAKESDNLVSF